MDVWMIRHLPAPGMQYAEETGHVSTDVFWIGRQFFNGLRRGGKHGRIAQPLVTADDAS